MDSLNLGPLGITSDGNTLWTSGFARDDLYAFDLESKASIGTRDIDTMLPNADYAIEGLWYDEVAGKIWAVASRVGKVYSFETATGKRNEEFDVREEGATANITNLRGIWSNGETIWVVSRGDNKIYAYYFPVEPVLSTPVRRTPTITTVTTVDSSEIDDPDPARPSVIQVDQCVADIIDPDGGKISLGDTIEDAWASGCPSITRGGRLAKYYTFSLPITTSTEIALDSHLDTYLVLRRGGLSGSIVARDDDSGPANNSLISGTLLAGRYTIEATTFYSDGVEAEFTLSVKAVPRILYDGPVSDVAHADYSPEGPTMTVRLLPTLPMGTLEITIEDAVGFGEGAGPLGGARADGGSAGTVMLALPKSVWVQYDDIAVEVKQSGSWSAHTTADEQAILAKGDTATTGLGRVLLGLIKVLGQAEGAFPLLQSLTSLVSSASTAGAVEPDESLLDAVFRKAHANCVAQVTVPWLVQEAETTGVRVSVPMVLEDDDYLSLAASFVASGNQPALAQLHDLLATGGDAPTCQPRTGGQE